MQFWWNGVKSTRLSKWTDTWNTAPMFIEQDGNVASRRQIEGSKIFKEQLLGRFGKIFFSKISTYLKKIRTMPKTSKRGHLGSLNVFTNRKLKKCKRVPFDRIRKFSKKKSHSAEKTHRGGGLWSRLYFWKHKKMWFSARIEPAISCFSEN